MSHDFNALCSRCGQALKYVFYFEGKPVGGDCFERLMGIPVDVIRNAGYVAANGTIDLEGYKARQAQQKADREAAAANFEAERAEIEKANQWLIDELLPYAQFDNAGYAMNFFGSIVRDLRMGTKMADLPNKAVNIIIDKLTKGLRGKKRDAAYDDYFNRIKPEVE